MDETRLVDNFALIGVGNRGLIDEDDDRDELTQLSNISNEFSNGNSSKNYDLTPQHQQPIVDLVVIDRTNGEDPPAGFDPIWTTPNNFSANLNYSGLRNHEMFLCIRRGRDKPPITDIGLFLEGREKVMENVSIIETTPHGYPANLFPSPFSKDRVLITFRRATSMILCNTLAVTDICVIIESKGETAPHSFNRIFKNLNRSVLGPNTYLCYKKSVIYPPRLQYRPRVLYTYPPKNETNPSYGFSDKTSIFCFPMGAFIERWPEKITPQTMTPTFSTFLLSNTKQYGACICFYELFQDYANLPKTNHDLLNRLETNNDRLYASTSIVLFSRYPFFDAFRRFLFTIYQLIVSSNLTTSKENHLIDKIPIIEKYLRHFFYHVPFPSTSKPKIFVQYDEPLLIVLPEDNGLPQNGSSFVELLKNLGTDNTLNLFLYALLESKLLIHSLRSSVLTAVVEAVNSMLFPFQWQCAYIPLCPLTLSTVLSAPCPFIIGIDSRYFDYCEPPADVICVDLDTNIIIGGTDDQKHWTVKMFPKRPLRVLEQSLKEIENQVLGVYQQRMIELRTRLKRNRHDFELRLQMVQTERQIENRIREVFLRFMCACFYGYKQFLRPIRRRPNSSSTDAAALFDFDGFLRSRDSSCAKFYSHIVRTQMFIRFIEERSFLSSSTLNQSLSAAENFHHNYSLAFFDECCSKIESNIDHNDSSKFTLLDTQKTTMNFLSEKTALILPDVTESSLSSINGHQQETTDTIKSIGNASTNQLDNNHLKLPSDQNCSMKLVSSSPMVKRSKQEREKSQKTAREDKTKPTQWAYCILSNVYSLWFMHLPSMMKCYTVPKDILNYAYKILVQMNRQHLTNPDEICFRVLIQLCGVYDYPILAVKTYSFMKKTGVEWNAVTYGAYNKAVYEGTWERRDRWATLRSLIRAVSAFKNARRYGKNQRQRQNSTSSFDDDDSDGAMSIDSSTAYSTSNCLPTSNLKNYGSNENLQNNRSFPSYQDDRITSVLSTLAGTFKDITESPYFPKMAFKKIPSIDSYVENKIVRSINLNNSNIQEPSAKRLSTTIADLPARLDYSALQSIAFQTARSEAGILMTTSDIEIGDIGMLSYRLPVPPVAFNASLNSQQHITRRSLSYLDQPIDKSPSLSTGASNVKWELRSRTQVLSNDPLGLLNPPSTSPSTNSVPERSPSILTKPFSNLPSTPEEDKNARTTKDDEISSLRSIPNSLYQLRSRWSQSGLSALYNPKKLDSLKSFALDRLTDLKTSVVSTAIPLTQSKSLNTFKNGNPIKERTLTRDNSNGKLRGSHSSLISQQSSNSSTLNNIYFNGSEINHVHEDIKALRIDPSTIAIPIDNQSIPNSKFPTRFIEISSCNRCSKCNQFLYDEEIMNGWSPDESELHTVCVHCGEKTMPTLSVFIRDNGSSTDEGSKTHEELNATTPTNLNSNHNMMEQIKRSLRLRSSSPPITVHYLSPLVLRKELENLLDTSDPNANDLHHVDFMEKHSILFWNLIWFFKRIHVSSHLYEMLLRSISSSAYETVIQANLQENKCVLGRELMDDKTSISIRCMWDSPASFHSIAEPIYKTWEHDGYDRGHNWVANALITDEHSTVSGKIIRTMVSSIEQNDLQTPIHAFIRESSKFVRRRLHRRSMYRELLFLAIAALGREKISYDAFDREYNNIFQKVKEQYKEFVNDYDRCPSVTAIMCRRLFAPLEL